MPEKGIHTSSKSRRNLARQRCKRTNDIEYLKKEFDKFFKKWEGRILLACKRCHDLQPKVIREMKIGDGKGMSTEKMYFSTKFDLKFCMSAPYSLLVF